MVRTDHSLVRFRRALAVGAPKRVPLRPCRWPERGGRGSFGQEISSDPGHHRIAIRIREKPRPRRLEIFRELLTQTKQPSTGKDLEACGAARPARRFRSTILTTTRRALPALTRSRPSPGTTPPLPAGTRSI